MKSLVGCTIEPLISRGQKWKHWIWKGSQQHDMAWKQFWNLIARVLGINRHSRPHDADFTTFYSDRVRGSLVWRKVNRIRVRTNTVQSGKHWSKCIIKGLEPGTFRATQARGRHSITNWEIRMVSVLKLKLNQVIHQNSSIIDGKGFWLWRSHRPYDDFLNWEIGQSLENQKIE